MTESIASLFTLYVMTAGRRIYGLSRVRPLAKERSLDQIVEAIDVACAHDHRVLELDARRQTGPNPELPSIREFDGLVDQTLNMVDSLLLHWARREGKGSPGAVLHAELFPRGVSAHTRLSKVEQLAANARVLAALEAKTHQKWLAAHGFEALILELSHHQADFVNAMKSHDEAAPPTFKEVQQQRALGQELYLKVVILILAEFLDEPEARAQLLGPILVENRKVQALRRRRRVLPEVDPDSGEVLEGEEGELEGEEGELGGASELGEGEAAALEQGTGTNEDAAAAENAEPPIAAE